MTDPINPSDQRPEPTAFGPYETEQDTYTEPMPTEIRRVRDANLYSQDLGRLVDAAVLRHLHQACEARGIPLGAFDKSILRWLTNWEDSTVQVVIGLIERAYAAGLEAGGKS